VVDLKVIVLQQREEEGVERGCEPYQGVGGEEDDLAGLQAAEWNGYAPYLPIELRRLLSQQPTHLPELTI
jgi:hypothetical protein